MRNLKKYSNHSGYSADERTLSYNVSICKNESHTHYDKPYDSKIAYLEIPTGAYIDTGYVPTNNTGYFILEESNGYGVCFGMQQSIYNNNTTVLVQNDTDGNQRVYVRWCNTSQARSGIADRVFDIKINYKNSREVVVNDSAIITNLADFASTPTINILVGTYNYGGEPSTSNPMARFYNVQLTENEEIVMDLTPVRVGQVGYMYDRISKRLFGNSGTGEFALGNDIT